MAKRSPTAGLLIPLSAAVFLLLVSCPNPLLEVRGTIVVERRDPVAAVTTTIGPDGGVAVLGDEEDGTFFRLEAPPGSIAAQTDITVSAFSVSTDTPVETEVVGRMIWQVSPADISDGNEVTITVPVIGGIHLGRTYELVTRQSSEQEWSPLASELDWARNSLKARVEHFSWFAVFSRPAARGPRLESPAVVIKFYNGLDTPESVETALANIRSYGIPSVIVTARSDMSSRRAGRAYYSSSVIRESDGAHLFETAVLAARRLGLKIYAWVPMLLDAVKVEEDGAEVAAYEWKEGESPTPHLSDPDGELFMDPASPLVRRYLKEVVAEVSSLDVDGVILDWIRHKGWRYSFSPAAVERYNQLYGRDLLADASPRDLETGEPSDERVKSFRESVVTELVAELVMSSSKPVGAFVFSRNDRWAYELGQDLPGFLGAGVQWLMPMIYPEHSPGNKPMERYWAESHFAYLSGLIADDATIYPTLDDNPIGADVQPLVPSDYDWVVSSTAGLGGVVFYCHDGTMAAPDATPWGNYLAQIQRAFGLQAGFEPAPDIEDIEDDYVVAGQAYVGPQPALRGECRPAVWSLVRAPSGMTISATTGVVSWSPTVTGTWRVGIRATNADGSDEEEWSIVVTGGLTQNAEIVSISFSDDAVVRGQESVTATVTIHNSGPEAALFYVGGSAIAESGTTWYDFSPMPKSVTVASGGTAAVSLCWSPASSQSVDYYGFDAKVWRESSRTTQLDEEWRNRGFQVCQAAATCRTMDAWWTDKSDQDGDGYVRAATLHWNSSVVGTGSLTVYEKIYYKLTGGSTWTLFATTGTYSFSGTGERTKAIGDNGHDEYDWKIEIYRSGQTTPDDVRDNTDDAQLLDFWWETTVEDTPARVTDAWWTDKSDQDGDGYVRAATLHWNSSVVGTGSLTVYEKIYYKLTGGSTWTLFATTGTYSFSGTGERTKAIGGNGHDEYDWKIEIYRSGQTTPDDVRDNTDDAQLLDFWWETSAQDF